MDAITNVVSGSLTGSVVAVDDCDGSFSQGDCFGWGGQVTVYANAEMWPSGDGWYIDANGVQRAIHLPTYSGSLGFLLPSSLQVAFSPGGLVVETQIPWNGGYVGWIFVSVFTAVVFVEVIRAGGRRMLRALGGQRMD